MRTNRPKKRTITLGITAMFTIGIALLLGQFSSTGNAASTAAPKNSTKPTITGTAQEGMTLTASPGTWSGTTPITFVYQWKRCDKSGGNCYDAGGTTTQKTYRVQQADVGNTMRVRVTGSNHDGSNAATSSATSLVKAGAPPAEVNGCPTSGTTVPVSSVSLPARLAIDGQTASPAVIRRSTTTLVLRVHVTACNSRPVQGALVYATAVPFEQFAVPPEAATDASGWATLTMHQASQFPASSRQQLLAVFLRARKPGDPITGGISTRLLVSFPVSR